MATTCCRSVVNRQQTREVITIYEKYFLLIMCRPQLGRESSLDQSIDQNCLKKARRVVKKYRKMTLKREMNRLRQLLPKGEKLKQHEVLDQTILVIQQLEVKLLTRVKQGRVPSRLIMMMERNSDQSLDVDMLRSVVGQMMGK